MKYAILFLVLSSASIQAQESSSNIPLRILDFLFLPDGIAEGYELRSFLTSMEYRSYRATHTGRQALDRFYTEAFIISRGDIKASCLAALVASFEHRTIPVKLPFGASIHLPLTLESERQFTERVDALPIRFYTDSTDDHDKLQHFFGGAYFQKVLGMKWLVSVLGQLVEIGEDLFIIGGANERRDVVANTDGIHFAIGARAVRGNIPRPSDYLSSED